MHFIMHAVRVIASAFVVIIMSFVTIFADRVNTSGCVITI
jgi:hypothetical protein